MKSLTTSGFICLQDKLGLIYKVARIDYMEWEDGYFKYSFKPFYNVIDILPDTLFQGIPGLDLSLKKAVYERENIVPTFISERTPSEHREDVWDLLEENGMQALNRLEWLIKTNKRYPGDNFFVKPLDEKDRVTYYENSMYDLVKRSDHLVKKLLDIICYGDYLESKEISINDDTRLCYYKLLLPMYEREYKRLEEARRRSSENNSALRGRSEIRIDPFLFDRVRKDFINKKLSADEAAKILNISKSTFFRRLRALN